MKICDKESATWKIWVKFLPLDNSRDSFLFSLFAALEAHTVKMCLKIFLITLSLLRLISGRMQDFALDVNDILNERLMPMSLVAFESGDKSEMRNLSQQSLDDEFQCATRGKVREEDGTFNNAFSAMGYHRNMINNFLCSKFIAEKILDDIQPRQLERRLGVAKFSPEMEFMGNNSLDGGSKSHMLYDEGSYEYKNWLAK